MFNLFHYDDISNAYSQYYLQFVFIAKARENLITEEYIVFLQKFEIEFNQKYVFEFYDLKI